MSILGVKKNRIDTTEIEKKMARINIDLHAINSNDNELNKGINNVTLRVNNNEKMININKNKPDRKIICIYAGADGPVTKNQMFTFGDGGDSFVTPYPGQILSMSMVSLRTDDHGLTSKMVVNGKDYDGIFLLESILPQYLEFKDPIKIEAGDIIGFKNAWTHPYTSNTLVSAIIELFI